jgi:hypothetical protein
MEKKLVVARKERPAESDGPAFVSAGMAEDLELHGWAQDATTGRLVVPTVDGPRWAPDGWKPPHWTR